MLLSQCGDSALVEPNDLIYQSGSWRDTVGFRKESDEINKEVVLIDDRPRRDDRGFGSRPREMHTVKCSDCGAEAQVPFKPTEGRPVYCKDCYQKHRPPRRF